MKSLLKCLSFKFPFLLNFPTPYSYSNCSAFKEINSVKDLEVNVAFGKEIVLKNVKLKESALRDAGIPLRSH